MLNGASQLQKQRTLQGFRGIFNLSVKFWSRNVLSHHRTFKSHQISAN
jgi:hypothetical protein